MSIDLTGCVYCGKTRPWPRWGRFCSAECEAAYEALRPARPYAVTIFYWSDGSDLTIRNVMAKNPAEAEAKVVAWVNARAGYHYCDRLPEGTRIVEQAD